MKPTFEYIVLTCKHKYFVFNAGRKLKVGFWQLLIHDWSKFSPMEAPHYGKQFFGSKDDPLGFSYAWNHHQKRNKHHWEYWIPITGHNRGGYKDLEPLPMPEKYMREMVADWLGASRAYEGQYPASLESWNWFQDKFESIQLHSDTRLRVMKIVEDYFTR